jgi:hypothetical protein
MYAMWLSGDLDKELRRAGVEGDDEAFVQGCICAGTSRMSDGLQPRYLAEAGHLNEASCDGDASHRARGASSPIRC